MKRLKRAEARMEPGGTGLGCERHLLILTC